MLEGLTNQSKGITLIALVITIIVLLILAGITIGMLTGENGLLKRASDASETTKIENAREKVNVMLAEYNIDKYTKEQTSPDPLYDFFVDKLAKGEIEDIIDNTETEITIQVDGYDFTIDKETLKIIGEPVRTGGVRPTFETQITTTTGGNLVGGESEKVITINITNIGEFGNNYTIEVTDRAGNTIEKEANVVGSLAGQASFMITQSGSYTIAVTGTKDEITRTASKVEQITVVMATITTQFPKTYGVIDIIWLDTHNNVISNPISPAAYLGGLTAVKYDGTDWVTADTTNTGNDWYNYIAQTGTTDGRTSNWANARTSNSNAHFVWIPRYAYKTIYFDSSSNADAYRNNNSSTTGIIGYSTIDGMIDVTTGTPKLVEGTEPTNVIETVQTAAYSEYIPHPAFEFNGEKAGIWVGKYESSGSTEEVKIIPNTPSLNITVSSMFTASQTVKRIYGLSSDSHMMKNIEWGAVAYLTESKYGRNGTEVAMNSSNHSTGGGNYISNVLQSTTGNIYGIYDMNGTSWEYVAGYINNSNVSLNGYNTDLLTEVALKPYYADVYQATNDSPQVDNYEENKGMKGDAVYETSNSYFTSTSWHADYSEFPHTSYPMFVRGRLLRQ